MADVRLNENGRHEVIMARDEAIGYLADRLITLNLTEGFRLTELVGAELAAELTMAQSAHDLGALRAVGVTRDDIERVAELAQAEAAGF